MICAFVVLYDWLWRWPKLPGSTLGARLRAAASAFGVRGYAALAPGVGLLWLVRHWLNFHTSVVGQIYVDNPIVGAAPFQGVMTAVGVLGRYLGLLVFPVTLSSDYSYHQIPLYGESGNLSGDRLAWASLALVSALLVTAVVLRRRYPFVSWGLLFFFLAILPTSNLLFPIGSIMAERFLYLPSVGFSIAAGWALCRVSSMLGRLVSASGAVRMVVAVALPAVVLCAFGMRTYVRNADWRDSLSLWRSAVAAAPNSFKTHQGLANALWNDSRHEEPDIDAAIAEGERGLALLDRVPLDRWIEDNVLYQAIGFYYRVKGEFHSTRAEALETKALTASPAEAIALRAEADPERAVARPWFEKSVAILLRARDVDAHFNATSRRLSLAKGKAPEDIPDAGNYRVYIQLGLAYARLKDWPEVERAGRWIQRLAPGEVMGYELVGAALYSTGRPAEGAVQFVGALFLDPRNRAIWTDLTQCYVALGLTPMPISQTPQGFSLDDRIPFVRQNLNTAAAMLVQRHVEAKRSSDAQKLADHFGQRYDVPREAMTGK
jgi:tetratricopeptide (TPR) repeat protein